MVEMVGAADADVVWAARVSTKGEQSLDDIATDAVRSQGLINYLMRDRHGSPFEHSNFTFFVQGPIFMWREHFRHRIASYNEESGRYKSLFLANMSHELRTPLSTIIGYSEMILDEPAIAAHPTLVEDVQRIRMAGVHLLTLVNDVLDLSKIEAGGMALDMEDCETLPILHDVIAFARPLMGRNRNHFEVSLPEGEIWIHADRVRVRQCLLNLLSNAAKFTSNGLIRLSVDVHEGMLRCAVQDSGCGIAASDLPLLFQSFVRIARTTHNQPGTGLGLTLTQRMSRLMGGDITVASEAGVGSTFTLTIPLSTTPH